MTPNPFGTFEGADIVETVLHSDAGAIARIINWGAVVRDFEVPAPGGLQRVVLGYDRLDHYIEHSPYFGATIGRVGNRIAGGQFTVDGVTYRTPHNEGRLTLHGGPEGLGLTVAQSIERALPADESSFRAGRAASLERWNALAQRLAPLPRFRGIAVQAWEDYVEAQP